MPFILIQSFETRPATWSVGHNPARYMNVELHQGLGLARRVTISMEADYSFARVAARLLWGVEL